MLLGRNMCCVAVDFVDICTVGGISKIAYDLKTAGQILTQFHVINNVSHLVP